jgi:hypothetical protein
MTTMGLVGTWNRISAAVAADTPANKVGTANTKEFLVMLMVPPSDKMVKFGHARRSIH